MSRRTTALATAAAALALPATAAAHVTVSPQTVPAGGYSKVDFGVGHGCEGSPTTSLTLQLPEQVVSATPQVVPGWRITTKEGPLERPYDGHGEQIAEGVRQVTWTGRLAEGRLQEFGLSIRTEGKPGEQAPVKAIQRCEQGETRWIQLPVAGEEEPESPAPVLTLGPAEGAHGATATAPAADTSTPVAAVAGDDDGGDGLAIAGVVLGGLGLLAGGAALVSARRRTA